MLAAAKSVVTCPLLVERLVDFHSLIFCGGGDESVYHGFLHVAFHEVGLLPLGKEGVVEHVHHFLGSEGLRLVLFLIECHAHDALVVEQVPDDVVDLILVGCGRMFLSLVLQEVCVAGCRRREEPFGVGQHLINDILKGFFLAVFLHIGEGGFAIPHAGVV